jgi:DNA-binding MarR family transcriptional regulator
MALLTTTRKSQELASQIDLGMLDGLLSFYIRIMEIAVSRHIGGSHNPLGFDARTGTISTLLLITRHPGVRATTIAARLNIDKSIIVKIVGDLVGRGLVTKSSAPGDRRAFELHPTEQATGLARRVERIIQEHSDGFFAGLMTREEHDLVLGILRRAFNRLRGAE